MGECGCFSSGELYTLPGPGGQAYLIRLLPSCDYCDVGGGILIQAYDPEAPLYRDLEVDELPVLYLTDGLPTCGIKAFPSKSEVMRRAIDQAKRASTDEFAAEVEVEDMYQLLPQSPAVFDATESLDCGWRIRPPLFWRLKRLLGVKR